MLSLGDMPASEGFGAVGVAALGAVAALALMYGVLEVINAVYRKNHKNEAESKPSGNGLSGNPEGSETPADAENTEKKRKRG